MTAAIRPVTPADAGRPEAASRALPAESWDAARAVTEIYCEHYRSLVRLAALLVRDTSTAEDVVQDSFVAMHGGWNRLRDTEKALAYLRQAVVNRSRSVLRRRQVEAAWEQSRFNQDREAYGLDTERELLQASEIIKAARGLSPRQREVIALTMDGYTPAEISKILGIEVNATRVHLHNARQRLRSDLRKLQDADRADARELPNRSQPGDATASPSLRRHSRAA